MKFLGATVLLALALSIADAGFAGSYDNVASSSQDLGQENQEQAQNQGGWLPLSGLQQGWNQGAQVAVENQQGLGQENYGAEQQAEGSQDLHQIDGNNQGLGQGGYGFEQPQEGHNLEQQSYGLEQGQGFEQTGQGFEQTGQGVDEGAHGLENQELNQESHGLTQDFGHSGQGGGLDLELQNLVQKLTHGITGQGDQGGQVDYQSGDFESKHEEEHVNIPTNTIEHTKPYHVKVIKKIGVPVPHPVGVPVPQVIKVPVPQPYPVHISVPQPIAVPIYKLVPQEIEKKVPITVHKIVPIEIKKPYKIEIEKHHVVHVDKPYPVHIPVYKHVFHHVPKHGGGSEGGHGWH